MKKVYYCLMLCLFVLGSIGGIGYSVYNGAWPVAVGVAAISFMAWPKVVEFYNHLND